MERKIRTIADLELELSDTTRSKTSELSIIYQSLMGNIKIAELNLEKQKENLQVWINTQKSFELLK
jgi:hypothetical protein